MSTITAISPQKKKSTRYNIFIDGNFAFGIKDENLLKYKLKTGQNLSQDEIKTIIKDEEIGNLMNKSLNFLSFRPRSGSEVEDYLARKLSSAEGIKFAEAKQSPLILEVIAKLKNYKYINDFDFAKWWLESRLKSNLKGPRFIKMELMKKNIDKNIIDKVLESYTNQKSVAQDSLKKKLPKWQKLPEMPVLPTC